MSPLRKAVRRMIVSALVTALLTGLLLGAAVVDSRMQDAVAGQKARMSLCRTENGFSGSIFGAEYELSFKKLLPVTF